MHELTTNGYFAVHPGLWDYLPKGSHVRYQILGEGPAGARFRSGGYVRNHYTAPDESKVIYLENFPAVGKNKPGHVSFPVSVKSIELLWKKYDEAAFVELHLITNSLAMKQQEIEALKTRVTTLENILRKAIGH